MEESETATCTCFHGEGRLFQQDLPREHTARTAESSSAPGEQLQHDVGQQCGSWQAGVCTRGKKKIWNFHCGWEGISADPEGSVFCWVGGKRASLSRAGAAGIGGKVLPTLSTNPQTTAGTALDNGKAEGDAEKRIPQSHRAPEQHRARVPLCDTPNHRAATPKGTPQTEPPALGAVPRALPFALPSCFWRPSLEQSPNTH